MKMRFLGKLRNLVMVRRVVGHSMEPTLHNGQIIFATSLLTPKVGKIVIATYKQQDLIKRIDRKEGDKYYLAGDNDGHDIGFVNTHSVLGVVIR